MKNKILLIALCLNFANFSYTAEQEKEDQIGTLGLLKSFPDQVMPKTYWSDSESTQFKTLQDAINIAKINAFCLGLEDEQGVKGATSFYSGCMHAISSLKPYAKGYNLAVLECFLKEFPLASENSECLAIQLMADDLKGIIGGQKDIEQYVHWIQDHKKPRYVRNIISFINAYIKTRNPEAIASLYSYIKENIE